MRTRFERLWPLLALAVVVAIVLLSFPYLASAYYLEAGGRALDRPEEALEHLHKAIAWDSNNAQAFRLLASVYESQGNRPAAQEAVVRYTEIRPRNPLGHIELAELYEAMAAETQSADSEALQADALREWQKAGITFWDAIAIGESMAHAGQSAEAGNWYLRGIRLKPNLADGWYYLGTWYGTQKEPKLALESFRHGLTLNKFDQIGTSDFYYRIAATYQDNPQLGPVTEALHAYDKALALDSFRLVRDAAWAHARRAQVHYQLYGDGRVAEEEMLRAVELAPSDRWLYYFLGDLYEKEGQITEARAMFQRALHIDPEFEGARKRLEGLE